MGKKRVLVIGLDGATMRLIRPWVDQGKLKNFERLIKTGSYGVLESVIRPASPQAWSSFITGKNPGKHGVFGFFEKVDNSYNVSFVSAESRAGRSLWKIIGSHGLRVCVMNVPITYPPEEVNGLLMSGLDSPGVESRFTYPPELFSEITENVGEYILEAGMWGFVSGGRYGEALTRLGQVVERRFEVAKYLYEKEKWDFFMMVFTAPDRVQHNFWKYMDPTHPLYTEAGNKQYGDAIENVYKTLDEKVGRFLEMIDQDTVVAVMSDHGMGKNTDKAIYLNRFLEANGLLAFKDTTEKRLLSKARKLFFVNTLRFLRKQLWKRLQRKSKEKLLRLFPGLRDRMMSVFLFSRIDMRRTKIYADEGRSWLHVNLKGREPNGIVDPGEYEALRTRVIDLLEALEDPDTGRAIVERAYRREEIYHGEFVKKAPDIIIMWQDDEYRSRPSYTSDDNAYLRQIEPEELEALESNLQANADHRIDGILFLYGPHIRANHEIKQAHIMDLAPTLLHILGLPVPADMDGRVIEEAFENGYLLENPIRFVTEKTEEGERGRQGYSDEEADVIRERLQGLGYLEPEWTARSSENEGR